MRWPFCETALENGCNSWITAACLGTWFTPSNMKKKLFQSCWLQQWACTNDSSLYDKKFGINNDSNKETKNLAFAIIMDGGPSKSNHPVTLPTPFMKRQWKIWICKNQRNHAKSTEEPEKYEKNQINKALHRRTATRLTLIYECVLAAIAVALLLLRRWVVCKIAFFSFGWTWWLPFLVQ